MSTTTEPPPDAAGEPAPPTATYGPLSDGPRLSEPSGNGPESQLPGEIDSDVTAQRTEPNVNDRAAPAVCPRCGTDTNGNAYALSVGYI